MAWRRRFGAFAPLQRRPGTADDSAVLTIRTGRRYRWRLAGGRLIASGASLRFEPNRLERRRSGTYWECKAADVTAVRAQGRMWVAVETSAGTETFRVFGAAAVVPQLQEALHPVTTTAV